MTYNIYSKDGNTIRCFTDKVEYNGVFMGDVYINITVKSEIHIDFEIGDYIMYRGEKFTLQNIPTEKKVSDKKVNGEVFQYDNIKFTGEAPFCFSNADFNDFVGDSQTDVSFTAQPNFSFIAATPADLAQRIQVNMDRYYTGTDKWTIQMSDGYVVDEDHENLLITVSNISCWDALALFKSKYDINFITRGRVCTIGTSGSIKDITFKVGSFKGLYDMTRNVQSDQSIITRLISYGNTTNINPRYYSLVGAIVTADITHAYLYTENSNNRLVLQFDLLHTSELRDNISIHISGLTIHMIFGTYGEIAGYAISLLTNNYSALSTQLYNILSVDANHVPKSDSSVIVTSGSRKDNISDLSHISFDQNSQLPNNMAVTNLMLPGFPTQTLAEWVNAHTYYYPWLLEYINQGYTFSEEKFYPYVNSKNISSLGIRPKTEYFTTDDETHKDIYPSLQYFSDNRNEIVSVSNEDGTSISDNGLYQDGATVPKIKINIKDLGFYFDDVVISGTEPKLHFNNGYCGGRDFTIKSWSLDNTFLYCDRIKDDTTGKYYPNVYSPILEGDIFVLSDIYMPDTYIEQSSVELLRWNLKLLAKNDFTVFSYSLSPDNNFIKRYDDAIVDKSTTFHKTIKEGDFLLINDSDMNINGAITIDSLKITEGDGILPKYTITLKETKTVGTIKKIIQQIDALSGNGDTSGYNSSQIGKISYSYLKNRFLSREYNDSTPYSIGVGKDLTVGGKSSVGGDSTVKGKQTVTGASEIGGDSTVHGDQTVLGKSTLKDATFNDIIQIINGILGTKDFASSIIQGVGKGWNIDSLGNSEMESLTIRRFLEVPEIRFNRTTYVQGDTIQSCAGGQIKSITIDKDADGNNSNTGTIELRLEDNDIGEFDVDDICISIFCNLLDKSQNAVLTVDDGLGNRAVKGFATSMFRITSVSGERNEILTYSLRGVSERWTTSYHPQPLSTIAQRGNFSKVERQSLNISGIFPKPYLRIMHDVNYWEFSSPMIGCQFGNMENLAILGINMTGYSAYLNNIYMNGTISQFESIEPKMTFNGGGDNQIAEGQTKLMQATITNGYGMDITDKYPYWKITRDTGDVAADNIWNAQATIENGEFYLTYSATVDDLGGKESALYTVTASDGISNPVTETISL